MKVANNGREAVDLLFHGPQPPPFDVVLMDLQMPEMDGHQATAKIRSDLRFSSLPIIAMTAHATMEERQRCLAAGMNDHISKPIDPGNLFETVGRFYKPPTSAPFTPAGTVVALAQAAAASASDPSPSPSVGREPAATFGDAPKPSDHELPSIAGLDTKDGISRVAGNRKLYLKLLRQFMEQQAPAPAQITTALAKGDAALAERLAHTLKGVAGNIGAKAVQTVAGALEKLIRERADAAALESSRQQVLARAGPLSRAIGGCLGILRPQATSTILRPSGR